MEEDGDIATDEVLTQSKRGDNFTREPRSVKETWWGGAKCTYNVCIEPAQIRAVPFYSDADRSLINPAFGDF